MYLENDKCENCWWFWDNDFLGKICHNCDPDAKCDRYGGCGMFEKKVEDEDVITFTAGERYQ